MHALEFEKHLKRLNPRLYVGRTLNTSWNSELFSTGVYIRGFNNSGAVNLADADLSASDYKIAKELNETPDQYLTWCTYKWIPEGNKYNERGATVQHGWREILLNLHSLGHIDLDRARKVFKRVDLGNSSYDRLSHEQKAKL